MSSATFDYDAKGRLVGSVVTTFFGESSREKTYECKRDDTGRLTSCAGTDPYELTYEGDRLVRAVNTRKSGTTLDFKYAYDDNGRLITKTSFDGKQESTVRYTYNADGSLAHQLVTFGGETYDHTFIYTNRRLTGRHIQRSGAKSQDSTIRYEHDRRGRVIKHTETGASQTYAFTYDKGGRLVTELENYGDHSYTTTYKYSCR